MEAIRARPGLTSAIGGIVVAVLVFTLGGGSPTVAGIGLAALLALVFGVAMYTAMRRYGESPPS